MLPTGLPWNKEICNIFCIVKKNVSGLSQYTKSFKALMTKALRLENITNKKLFFKLNNIIYRRI